MTLREAAQQALEAIESDTVKFSAWTEKMLAAQTALRAALESDDTEMLLRQHRFEIGRLRAALAEPQRKPLTDEQVRDLWSWSMTAEAERTATTQQHAFARAIEAAHGITGGSNE